MRFRFDPLIIKQALSIATAHYDVKKIVCSTIYWNVLFWIGYAD